MSDYLKASAIRAESGRLLRFTRNWLHYGSFAFVALCALVAAAEGLLAR